MSQGIKIRQQGSLWLVERGNYLLGEFKNEQQALQLARVRAKSSHAELVVFDKDGIVSLRETYREDNRKAG